MKTTTSTKPSSMKKSKGTWKNGVYVEDVANGVGRTNGGSKTLSVQTTASTRSRGKKDRKGSGSSASYSSTATPAVKKVTLEIPFCLTPEQGLALEKKSRMSIDTSLAINRKLKVDIQGSAAVRRRIGYSTAKADLTYSFPRSGASTGSGHSIKCGLSFNEKPYLNLGGTLKMSPSSSLTCNLCTKNPTTLASLAALDRHKLTLSHSMQSNLVKLNSNCALLAGQPPSFGVAINSLTMHKWSVGANWASTTTRVPKSVSLSITPKIKQRLVRLWTAIQWKEKSYQVGATFSRTSSDDSSVAVGWTRLQNNKGWTWLFSWSLQGYTIRIPIAIATSLLETETSLALYAAQTVYLSILSQVVQELVFRIVFRNSGKGEDKKEKDKSKKAVAEKARTLALDQQFLMKRTAKNRMDAERKKSGLVITKAVYFVENGESEPFDVTIPLQFWVSDSTLDLPATSKRDVLGFYDMSTTELANGKDETNSATAAKGSSSFWSWWKGFWSKESDSESSSASNKVSPKLTPKYVYADHEYIITIKDREMLSLPSSNATRLS